MATMGIAGGIMFLFLLILALLWCMMPFLIMGTNGRLDRIVKQNERILEQLGRLGPYTPAARHDSPEIGSKLHG